MEKVIERLIVCIGELSGDVFSLIAEISSLSEEIRLLRKELKEGKEDGGD